MVDIVLLPEFIKAIKHLDKAGRVRLEAAIRRILENPERGKPLRHMRNERTFRMGSFRIIYSFQVSTLYLLKFENRESVYRR
ncbi:MAG: type II toxin-antitoxin system RelE/ParE family toxin [Candidatus Woesearchaeota archaeon]